VPYATLREDVSLAEVIRARRETGQSGSASPPRPRFPAAAGPDSASMSCRMGFGLLVLHGLLIRHAGISCGYGAELLGEGDLLRPWQGEDGQAALPQTTAWQVLAPARLPCSTAVSLSALPATRS
jgi:CRP/FNR family transcriptional regulator, cyclic AMP receptor protein